MVNVTCTAAAALADFDREWGERVREDERKKERDKCRLSGFWGGLASPAWAHVPVPDSLPAFSITLAASPRLVL